MNEERRSAEWFNQGPLVSKEANGLTYEVWANGTFATTAPNGDRFKGHDSAQSWLIERGITNDEQLNNVLNNENGWETDMNRWFDLIVFEFVPVVGWVESYCGEEPCYDYDEEGFNAWIDEAIKLDEKE